MNTLTYRVRIVACMCRAGFMPLLCFLMVGCGQNAPPQYAATSDRLSHDCAARVGDVEITRQALEQELGRRGAWGRKQEVLEEMIHAAVLLNRARTAGYDRDPRVVARVNQLIVSTFQEDQLAKWETNLTAITFGEIESHYRTNAAMFTLPQAARAGILFLKCSPRATPDKRAESRQNAERLLAEARQATGPEFARLVERYSDDQATRYTAGDTGWLSAGPASRWPSTVLAAALGLEKPDDFASIIEAEGGFYIVRLLERKPRTIRPLAEVRETIEYRVAQEKKRLQHHTFIEEMKKGVRVEVNLPLIDSMPSPARAEQKPPALPRT